jgi:hypothetical protein
LPSEHTGQIDCQKHGLKFLRFLCIHAAQATETNSQVGFFWAEQEGDLPPIAWCNACEEWLRQPGASWNEEFKRFAAFVPFCADCYDIAKHKALGKDGY